MRVFKGAVIHCSDSSFGTGQDIDDWHIERGFNEIGYHVVICNGHIDKGRFVEFMDGSIEVGRDWDKNGAHAKGYNGWIGICMIGVDEFTTKQFESLVKVCKWLISEYGIKVENIIGHYECKNNGGKTCPNTDMEQVRKMLLAELEDWHG
ncbi:peptidoglycan recognition protein family protein [Poseidonibacter lekithochrous]|uniref:peptidoglycan recognition protein family protein n=1 Tax=Poseidonibacter lekithochrous TaxID=1904463 RepID=UPI000D3C2B6F|nr:peptidoglycan recognition family protein [Poseidonibacter lekithochrous]